MKTKIQIKSIFGSLLFEYECEDNTIRKTVEEAISKDADLTDANLTDANLTRADLTDANLTDANLNIFKHDFWAVLLAAKHEIPALKQSVMDGKINGSTYQGECACLVGTIANTLHCQYNEVPNIKPDSGRPAECWFMMIKTGDTPETNQASQKIIDWIDEFQMLLAL